jgi:2-methylcitrate dehydratase PrpD
MVSVRARAKAIQAARQTYRQRVQLVIETANACLTGHAIADLTGLTYRQTVDALNALVNQGRIARTGRKFTARWCPLTTPDDPSAALQAALNAIARRP